MHILSIALGGCLKAEPVRYGVTEDTGGHIAYILGEMRALAEHSAVTKAEIVTRLFSDPALEPVHAEPFEKISPNCFITRIDSGNRRYLSKEALAKDRAPFIRALLENLRQRDRLPDLIHAHFADAADVARHIQAALGIPYIYTAHSLGIDKRMAMGDVSDELEARIAEESRAIDGAAAIIGSSRDECERQLLNYPSAKLSRIHRLKPGIEHHDGGLDALFAKKLIGPFLSDPQKPIVLAIARPVHKKNLAGLVDAFAADPELRERANLVILAGQRKAVGEGEPEQVEVLRDLVDRIDRHDLHGHVAYPRVHDRGHVIGLYTLAARTGGVFVNPALVEPFGLTLVEAASHGLPVVATKIGGAHDTVSELEHGLLIDPTNTEEIAAAIRRLLTDTHLWARFQENALIRSQTMRWSGYAEAFVKIAQPILKPSARPRALTGPKVESLLVSDLDNTITGDRKGVRQLRRFLKKHPDIAFVIATGRSIVEARRIAREWDVPEPAAWITSVGSEIYWSSADGFVADPDFPGLAQARWDVDAVERAAALLPSLEPQPEYEQRAFKRSYFYSRDEDVPALRAALNNEGLAVRVIASHGRLLDVLPTSAGKAAAMMHVADKLGVARDRIFAAGDSGNDEDMLMLCANAIMVQNHASEIAFLNGRPNLYLSRRPHASGVVEGLEAHQARRVQSAVQIVESQS